MSSAGGPAGAPTTPTRKSKFFNVALSDEAAQTPRLRIKPSVSSSEKDHDPEATEVDNERQQARSLSPDKLRRSHSAGTSMLTPVITPVMKQLRRISRSATRSASPGKSQNTLTINVKNAQGVHSTGARPQSTPPLTTKSPSKKSSRVGTPTSGTSRPDTMSRTLKPPSGRFSVDDVLSDEENAPQRPSAPARSASLPASPPGHSATEKPTSTTSVSESPTKPKHTRHLEDGDLIPKRPSSSKSINSSRRRRSTSKSDTQGGKERSSAGARASSETRSSANGAQPPIHPPSASSTSSKKPPSSSSQSSSDVPPRPSSSRRHLHTANDEVEKPLSSSSADSAAMRHSNSSTTSDPPQRPKPRRNLSGEGALLQPSSANSVHAKKPSSGSSNSEAPPKPSSRRHLSSEDRRHSDPKVPTPTESSEEHKVRRSRRKPEERAPKKVESDGGQPKPLNRSRSATPSRRHLGEELNRASAGRGRDHTKSPSGRRRRSVKEGGRGTSQERKAEAVPDQSLLSPNPTSSSGHHRKKSPGSRPTSPGSKHKPRRTRSESRGSSKAKSEEKPKTEAVPDQSLLSPKPTSSSDHHRKKSPGSRPTSPGSRHKPRRTRSESRGSSKAKPEEKVRAPPERTRSKSEERPENAYSITSPKPSTHSDHRRKSPGHRPTSPSSRHKPRRTRSESRGHATVKGEEKVRSPPERSRSRSEEPEARPKSTATILTSNKSSSSHASRRSAERAHSKSPTSKLIEGQESLHHNPELARTVHQLVVETCLTCVGVLFYPSLGKTQETRANDPGFTVDGPHMLVMMDFLPRYFCLGPSMIQSAALELINRIPVEMNSVRGHTTDPCAVGIAIIAAAIFRAAQGGLPPWAVESVPALFSSLYIAIDKSPDNFTTVVKTAMTIRLSEVSGFGGVKPGELLSGRFFDSMGAKAKGTFIEQAVEIARADTQASWKRLKALVKQACGGKKKDTDFGQRPGLTKYDSLDRV